MDSLEIFICLLGLLTCLGALFVQIQNRRLQRQLHQMTADRDLDREALSSGVHMESGVGRIALERAHQLQKWSAEHDDTHACGEIPFAAFMLLRDYMIDGHIEDHEGIAEIFAVDGETPWGLAKHLGPRRRLVIAGALIAAEIDRINRIELRKRCKVTS